MPEPLHSFRARIWFESWTQQSSEPVCDNFRFQYEISYTCCNCKEVLAREGHVAHMHTINPEHRPKRDRTDNTIIDIVHELSRPIAVDKAYSTPCKRKCSISKRRVVSQTKFVRLPKYLILRINRTCHDSASSRIIKNQSCVRTPMSLNISHAMATPCSAQKATMSLVACVRHVGLAATSGHYTADCFRNNCWFRFDDDEVQPCVPSFEGAVMLMYHLLPMVLPQ